MKRPDRMPCRCGREWWHALFWEETGGIVGSDEVLHSPERCGIWGNGMNRQEWDGQAPCDFEGLTP